MHIYMSGIGGVGLGPLAEIANGAGFEVSGSDLSESLTTQELVGSGIDVIIYPQDGSRLRELHEKHPIDWFVYTSALSAGLPELEAARELGIRTSKRDELLSHIISEKHLKLIAVAGTHGKTTTTGMLVWAFTQLGIPISYSVGSTLSFGPAGLYDESSEYFVYECDEYDRNFLAFHPYVALITSFDHDHFDTYPTLNEYVDAFKQFSAQSGRVYTWQSIEASLGTLSNGVYLTKPNSAIHVAGEHNRRNASLARSVLADLLPLSSDLDDALNSFPGTNRRFEKLADNLYSDYGHHPIEIEATLQLASELGQRIVLVYQPHQNGRQHEVIADYTAETFKFADKIYWLPTYLTREDPAQKVLSPTELAHDVPEKMIEAELDDSLWSAIEHERQTGALVLCMGAGTIDGWIRAKVASA